MFKIYLMLLMSCFGLIAAADPLYSIRGQVHNEQGKPLIAVSILIKENLLGTQTDTIGRFVIDKLKPGEYTLIISAVGYEKKFQRISINKTSVNNINLSLKRLAQNLKEVNVLGKQESHDNLIDFTRTPMPATVITRKQIEMMGSRRLDEVLKEQTGLAIVNDIGSGARAVGLQLQGFDSGYTMIMIDGQPMTGRNSGNFDLSRITVANIERIEIIKGASSCLFGSEALAGVVNIVTRQNIAQSQGLASVRYGSFNTLDATLEGETPFAGGKGSGYLSGNYYRTDGFNANPYLSEGKTAPPYNSYTLQGRARYTLSKMNALNITGRYAVRNSVNQTAYNTTPSRDVLNEKDLNASAILNTNFNSGWRVKTQYYLTRYATDQNITNLAGGYVIPSNNFVQYMHRGELQAAQTYFGTMVLTGGTGIQYETMNDNLYSGAKSQSTAFVYGQADWKISDELGITGGVRGEHHSRYGSSLNPSFGLKYQPVKALTLKAAVATGFKTPDFRQLYLNFTNLAGGGYTVLGTDVFAAELQKLQDAGQISAVFANAARVTTLKPERSVAYSAGFTVQLNANLKADVNGFYNDVRNFINTDQVASKTGGQQVFSYFNIDRALLAGADIGLNWKAGRGLNISAGYQLLYAKDRGVIDSIKAGTGNYAQVYDPNTSQTRRSKVSDYFGLNNRSRHMANIKFTYEYEPKGITATFRVNYRGKYGFQEANRPNGFLDPYDTYVSGFFLLNASLQKTLMDKHFSIQVTADNFMNYRDQLMPAQSGRTIMLGLNYRFFKNKI
ncbi:TonB-dependent receptor [Mucilaginibacter lappiensis]|uniref:TonB-dependent receptor n=1 Tax=Mucilaginibacter lappiensis TaxID=354630 RepID=UPI003D259FD1